MALDTLKFVDSIASSPTTRLDLNDGSLWYVREFYAPPPRLRRSLTTNAMTDGAYATSSTYDNRVITVVLDLVSTTEDINATELQKLARELDRSTNFLQYKPDGATSPVFFRTERADFSDLVDFNAALAMRRLTIEIVAEPFALGLRETINVGAISTATGYFDIASANIKGDVAAPFIMTDGTPTSGFTQTGTGSADLYWLLARSTRSAASQPVRTEASTVTMGTNTAVSGSDAVTTFANTSENTRLTWSPTGATAAAMNGTYRLFVGVTGTSATSAADLAMSAKYGSGSVANTDCASTFVYPIDPAGSQAWLLDFGLVSFSAADAMALAPRIEIVASVSSVTHTRTATWDFLYLAPADEATMLAHSDFLPTASMPGGVAYPTSSPMVFDGVEDAAYIASSSSIFSTATPVLPGWVSYSGAIPTLVPNYANRFAYLRYAGSLTGTPPSAEFSNAASGTLTIYYHPLYAYVRPATT